MNEKAVYTVCLTLCFLASVAAGAVSTFRLTVPEGYTLARIGMLLEENGVCTADAFIAASQSGDYSAVSPLIAAQPPAEGRCFRRGRSAIPVCTPLRRLFPQQTATRATL